MTQPYLILPTAPARNYKDHDGARWFAPQLDERGWYVERVDEHGATVYTFDTWPEAEEFWSGIESMVDHKAGLVYTSRCTNNKSAGCSEPKK